MPTVPTFAVRETDVSRHNGGTSGAPLKPLRDDSALRALSSLSGLRGAPEVPPLCRETSVSRTANVETMGKNGLKLSLLLEWKFLWLYGSVKIFYPQFGVLQFFFNKTSKSFLKGRKKQMILFISSTIYHKTWLFPN